MMAKVVPADREKIYNHPVYFFRLLLIPSVLKEPVIGTQIGFISETSTGRGKNGRIHKPNRSIKAVCGYPQSMDF